MNVIVRNTAPRRPALRAPSPAGFERLGPQTSVPARGILHTLAGDVETVWQVPEEVPLDARDVFRQRSLRLQELTALLQETLPVDPPSGPVAEVRFGATVSLLEPDDGRRFELRLVGEDEAAPEQGLLNWRSPLGQRLLGARVGDDVEWQRAASVVWLEVLAVRYD
jgi:transcription elongation GreA/GreB family factor